MKMERLVIYDTDELYANHLMEYISNKKGLPFQTMTFTNKDVLFQFLKENSIEVLLISEEDINVELNEFDIKKIIILSEGNVLSEHSNYSTIFKFKSAENILRDVLVQYATIQNEEGIIQVAKGKANIVGVYSPVGRCGKTTFALSVAEILSETNKTLFISFEECSPFRNMLKEVGPGDLSDLMYYFKQNPETIAIKLQAVIQNINNLEFVSPLLQAKDLRNIDTEEWINLIEKISSANTYEKIVLDISNMIGDVISLLNYCDEVYVPVIDDYVSEQKQNAFEQMVLQSDNEHLLDKLVKVRVPQIDISYYVNNRIETLGMSEAGDYVRQVIERENNAYR